jgi:hypothetical protein
MNTWLIPFLIVSNEAITAVVVVIAASLVLYNLSHSWQDRVVRASSIVLSCIIITYIGTIFLILGQNNPFARLEGWLRIQWIGISFMPAALFHLSDTLLSTTGVISRGRRRRIVRLLYIFGAVFLLVASFTDLLIYGLETDPNQILLPAMKIGGLFPLFLLYFGIVIAYALNNVVRARQRSLSKINYRRMTYLLLAFPMPAVAIFPYTLILPRGIETAVWVWLVMNLGSTAVALMLAFIGYPLAFYGNFRPDRVVKGELLRFFLRGPLTGIIVLLVILFLPATRLFGLPGPEFLPFVAVAAVLLMQWGIAAILPRLDKWLVYGRDQEDALQLRELGERLLTQADTEQLLETILAAACDHLRTPSAFVIALKEGVPTVLGTVGSLTPSKDWLSSPEFATFATDPQAIPADAIDHDQFIAWRSFWLIPLTFEEKDQVIGFLGLWARSAQPDLSEDDLPILETITRRAARVLEDTRLQDEILIALKGLLPEIDAVQQLNAPIRHAGVTALTQTPSGQSTEITKQPEFIDLIRDALRDYWGGPRLTEERLLQLKVVKNTLTEQGGNPAQAVRTVLSKAIESMKPAGQPSLSNEWLLYNVLEMRFVQGKRVLEVADLLAMSEANLHRKQRAAIEQVVQRIIEMEQRVG